MNCFRSLHLVSTFSNPSNKTLITLPEDKRLYQVIWQNPKYDESNEWLMYKPSFLIEKIKNDGKNYMSLIFNQSQIKIIGNIHDNAELLK